MHCDYLLLEIRFHEPLMYLLIAVVDSACVLYLKVKNEVVYLSNAGGMLFITFVIRSI